MDALFELPEQPEDNDPTVYRDPFPGKKGDELVWDPCYCGDGLYHAPSGVHWDNGHGDQRWHFDCDGKAGWWRKVSTIRARVRRQAKAAKDWKDGEAERDRIAAESLANAIREAWDEAHAEQARRAALVQGFVGEIGDKIRNVPGTVKVKSIFESGFGYRTFNKVFMVIELEDGHLIKFSGTGDTLWAPERDDKVIVKLATVKGFDNYQGQDQTEVTRVKLEVVEG